MGELLTLHPASPTDVVARIFDVLGARVSSQDTPDGPLLTARVACSTDLSSVGFRFPSSNVTTAANGSVQAQVFNVSTAGLLVASTNSSDPNCTISLVGQAFADLPGLWVLGQCTSTASFSLAL